MKLCYFVSDLHGKIQRYKKLFDRILIDKPEIVFVGGDLLPSPFDKTWQQESAHLDFIGGFLRQNLSELKYELGSQYPDFMFIMGNDDPKFQESSLLALAATDLCEYVHNRQVRIGNYIFYGYNYVPPSPFQLKDWEKYDVSRYVDPGCVSPEEGVRSVPISEFEARYSTIADDLSELVDSSDLSRAVFLFHAPPYRTNLDRAALDGKFIDSVPLDVNVGSIAIRNFIEQKQPYLTLHGHVHESYALTGKWADRMGYTHMFSSAYDGEELMLVKFDLDDLSSAEALFI